MRIRTVNETQAAAYAAGIFSGELAVGLPARALGAECAPTFHSPG